MARKDPRFDFSRATAATVLVSMSGSRARPQQPFYFFLLGGEVCKKEKGSNRRSRERGGEKREKERENAQESERKRDEE